MVRELQKRFPNNLRLVDAHQNRKGIIEVDGQFCVSVLICGKRSRAYRSGNVPWVMRVAERDRSNVALVCIVGSDWKSIIAYYVLPPLQDSALPSRLFTNFTWLLRSGKQLNNLADFLKEVRTIASSTSGPVPVEDSVIPSCS